MMEDSPPLSIHSTNSSNTSGSAAVPNYRESVHVEIQQLQTDSNC